MQSKGGSSEGSEAAKSQNSILSRLSELKKTVCKNCFLYIHRNQGVYIQLEFLGVLLLWKRRCYHCLRDRRANNNNNWKRKAMWKLPLSSPIKCLLIVFCRICVVTGCYLSTCNSCYTFRRRFSSSTPLRGLQKRPTTVNIVNIVRMSPMERSPSAAAPSVLPQ